MKVLFYIHFLGIGGAETIVTKYLIALKNSGIDVVLVTDEHVYSFLSKEVENHRIKEISLFPQTGHSIFGKIKRRLFQKIVNREKIWNDILEEERPDIVHINTNVEFFHNPKFFSASHLVYTFHGELHRSLKIYGKENYAKIKHLAEDGMNFYSLSSRMSKDIHDIFHTCNIYYTPNGINLDEIKSNAYSRFKAREALGIYNDCFVVGQVGRIQPVKNQLRSISIFSEVVKRKANAVLVFVGGSDNENYLNVIKQKATELGVIEKIIFAGLRKDAVALMNGFDCMLLTSITESFSLVLVEAQAQNVKCVSSDVVPEEVICNSNCIAIDLEKTDDFWADYIVKDFQEKHKGSLLSFQMENVISNMIKNYQEIANK